MKKKYATRSLQGRYWDSIDRDERKHLLSKMIDVWSEAEYNDLPAGVKESIFNHLKSKLGI